MRAICQIVLPKWTQIVWPKERRIINLFAQASSRAQQTGQMAGRSIGRKFLAGQESCRCAIFVGGSSPPPPPPLGSGPKGVWSQLSALCKPMRRRALCSSANQRRRARERERAFSLARSLAKQLSYRPLADSQHSAKFSQQLACSAPNSAALPRFNLAGRPRSRPPPPPLPPRTSGRPLPVAIVSSLEARFGRRGLGLGRRKEDIRRRREKSWFYFTRQAEMVAIFLVVVWRASEQASEQASGRTREAAGHSLGWPKVPLDEQEQAFSRTSTAAGPCK